MDTNEAIQVFTIVSILITLALVVIFRNSLFIPSEDTYGEYVTSFTGVCESEVCGQNEGSQIVIQKCIPNETTGRGCLFSDGTQHFNTITTNVPCSKKCNSFEWQLQSESKCMLPTDNCVLPGTLGSRESTYVCVRADLEGPNQCVASNLDPSASFQQFFLGDTFTLTKSCTDFPNAVCNVLNCRFNPVLTALPNCETQSSSPFNILQEGVIYEDLGQGSSTGCSTLLITPDDIINGTIPADYNPFICPNSKNKGASCAAACRSFPFPGVIFVDDLDFLYGNYFLVRIPDVGYLAPSRGLIGSSLNSIDDVSLMIFTFDLGKPGCTQDEVEFSTAVIFAIGPRGSGLYQLILTINTSYLGFLGSEPSWKQALNIYNGPGITSNVAEEFQVQLIDENTISIKTSSGESIAVNSTDGIQRTLDELELVVFSPNTNFSNRCRCNLNICLDDSTI